ncbi:transferase hexapeptide (six repeat-containing protein) [Pseudomonas guineae]|uniref:Transferase hexapeptide (Six repeat-containing protein) n=1 Tax=Pseudomonas guineae TaxID=425504 RepID=A0A1I3CTL6_9PSED|nr:acetyltransferase [Pseudomonas guineae]SFH77884.1 transferase hexapeptide (six repeat-containing protein) [Pseudomonas guineae]
MPVSWRSRHERAGVSHHRRWWARHSKAVAEAALLSGEWQRIAFVDDRWPELCESFGWPVVTSVAGLAALKVDVAGAIAAVGNNAVREQCVKAIYAAGLPLVTVVHPRACVSVSVVIGAGTAIMALAMVGVDAVIGEGAIVNANATIDHDASLGAFAHLGVGVQLAGGVEIAARAWLQAGCSAGY